MSRTTRAFLLAAGLGTRLRPLTDTVPKCLLPIGGKPLLHIWLESLESAGITDVLINTHWLADKVEQFVANYQGKLQVRTFFEPTLLGSAGTIIANRDWAEQADDVLILYADNLTTVNLDNFLRFHCSHDLPLTLGVFHADDPCRCGIVQVDEANTVTEFIEKPQHPKSDLAAGGIYAASSRLIAEWSQIAGGKSPVDLGTHILPAMAGRIKAHLLQGILLDIGTPESYEQAQSLYLQESRFRTPVDSQP